MTSPRTPPPTNHAVTAADAAEHTRRHRATLSGAHSVGSHGGSFDAKQVAALLAKGCAYLAIYHGKNAKGEHSCVLVGRDAAGKDMVGATDMVLETWFPCPPWCDEASMLNK